MPQQTQTEMFIQTLAQMREEERERQKFRLRLEVKAHAERFMKAFRTNVNDSRRPSE